MLDQFNILYQQILEMNTSGSLFPSPATGSPQDVYAPGDSRVPFILGQDPNKKLKSPVFRRKLDSRRKRKK